MDHPLSRAETVTVLKLEAEQSKMRSIILSLTATLWKVEGKESNLMQQLESRMNDEFEVTLLMMLMVVVYVIIVGFVLC